MPREVHGEGPLNARIMIVGEAPGAEEEVKGLPFIGPSGYELDRMLAEAGISRNECFVTNVCRVRPPDFYKGGKRCTNDISQWISTGKGKPTGKFFPPTAGEWLPEGDRWVKPPIAEGLKRLRQEIAQVKPNIIIPVGNLSMWALTGRWGISKWRGSMLHWYTNPNPLYGLGEIKVIPTYHPAYVLRDWSSRAITVNDLKRARIYSDGKPYWQPEWRFIVRPGFEQCMGKLCEIIRSLEALQACPVTDTLRLSFDIETSLGHITCAGLAWSAADAICIPFTRGTGEHYWTDEEETQIVFALYRILTHPRADVVGQNLLYDSQYTWRHWYFVPRVIQDTMISQHSVYSDLPKALAYLASMYCKFYVYWKDEGKEWLPGMPEDRLWHYNCLDCTYTYEVSLALEQTVTKLALDEVHAAQQAMFWPVLQAMQRGIAIDRRRRDDLITEVIMEIEKRQTFLWQVLGHDLNVKSPLQVKKLFYEDFKLRPRIDRKTGQPSTNDESLQSIAREEPLFKGIVNAILDIRTLNIFHGTFLTAGLDVDGRMRCSYNIGGSSSGKSAPKTFRLSSSENAFGGGCNLQTIPSEKSKSIGKAKARGGIPGIGEAYQLPDLRSMYVPDNGHTFFNGDLDRADLQVVCWETDDPMLKAAMRMGVDIHLMNVYTLDGQEPPPLEELVEGHPRYLGHRGPRKLKREFSKVFCHGTNYGGGARTMAANTGRLVAEIDKAQKIWFGAHPGIKRWHDRVKAQVTRSRYVENRFGYRWYVFDRIDSIIPEAIAWIPQSTVSIVINRIWQRYYTLLPDVQVLLQVHDSLGGQVPTLLVDELRPKMLEAAKITVPYEDPLVIPFSIGFSTKHWGDC